MSLGGRHKWGSSPHTRGAPTGTATATTKIGIIPAYAGSTRLPISTRTPARDHPRIRGEHGSRRHFYVLLVGSSPHTRGARTIYMCRETPAGIIPAYAGSTTRSSAEKQEGEDHPRIRGEHICDIRNAICMAGSSPHTRGAPNVKGIGTELEGIIPAYAGSTRTASRPTPACGLGSSPHTRVAQKSHRFWQAGYQDHPRIRGEHGQLRF